MAEFSLELNEEQKTLQEWLHGFAVNEMRPIASEWDEREETPWEFINRAAELGIYSMDFIMDCFSDPTGLKMMIALEELSWGDAGLGMSLLGTSLGSLLGATLGSEVGATLGSEVGTALGSLLGTALGITLGTALGSEVGTALGSEVGATLGSEV